MLYTCVVASTAVANLISAVSHPVPCYSLLLLQFAHMFLLDIRPCELHKHNMHSFTLSENQRVSLQAKAAQATVVAVTTQDPSTEPAQLQAAASLPPVQLAADVSRQPHPATAEQPGSQVQHSEDTPAHGQVLQPGSANVDLPAKKRIKKPHWRSMALRHLRASSGQMKLKRLQKQMRAEAGWKHNSEKDNIIALLTKSKKFRIDGESVSIVS